MYIRILGGKRIRIKLNSKVLGTAVDAFGELAMGEQNSLNYCRPQEIDISRSGN